MDETRRLALVGLVRCELTEYGDRLPAFFEVVPVASIEAGLLRLEEGLTSLLHEADNPASEANLYEARLFVRDALLLP